ncbi:hypothetical protein [Niabella hibiscisoli]|uniref:hypothetical protein n=1 Tax=Niabella hibiscisoli TaxID=1825928 RepID=UPI001F0D9CF2|nr:hypothetical protein [Niabella hibiscisoli]MCH5718330.1 hypothetical protein [Niabella hibiscisoli]
MVTPVCTSSIDIKFNTIFAFPGAGYVKGSTTGLYLNDNPTRITERVTKVRAYNKDILACTDNGLYIKREEKYFHINEKRGLPGNQCVQIDYSGDKFYKLLTQKGLAYIDTGTCKIAGTIDAQLLGRDVIIHHFDVEKDSVWLATNKGIFVIDEKLLLHKKKNNTTAYLYPEQLSNRIERYTQHSSKLQYDKENLVKMIIDVLDFSPKPYYIAYKVEKDGKITTGLKPATDQSFFVNTNGPGNYTITLFVGTDELHIDKTITYLLNITPLWYQTLLARVIFIVTTIVILWFIVRLVIRYIINKKKNG